MKLEFVFQASQGIPARLQKIIDDYLRENEGKYLHFYLGYKKKSKSKEQRGYYWGVVLPLISDHTGYERHEIHELNKEYFLKVWVRFPNGTEKEKILSTEDLDASDTERFYEEVRRYWGSQGVPIPKPNEIL
jgi:hypothetical protein